MLPKQSQLCIHSLYKVSEVFVFVRSDAEAHCQTYGSDVHLMSINSTEELDAMKVYMTLNKAQACKSLVKYEEHKRGPEHLIHPTL